MIIIIIIITSYRSVTIIYFKNYIILLILIGDLNAPQKVIFLSYECLVNLTCCLILSGSP